MPSNTDNKKHPCGFCGKAFSNERTLERHTCEQKRRHSMRDVKHVKLAFDLFCVWYQIECNQKGKTFEDFRTSKFYLGFVKFGKYCTDAQVLNPEEFMRALIGHVKIDRWPDDELYVKWMRGFLMDEKPAGAWRRSRDFMRRWGTIESDEPGNFFRNANENQLAYWIQTGRVSPYVIFCSESGTERLGKLQGENLTIALQGIWKPQEWSDKIKRMDADELDEFKQDLKEFGL